MRPRFVVYCPVEHNPDDIRKIIKGTWALRGREGWPVEMPEDTLFETNPYLHGNTAFIVDTSLRETWKS